MVSARIVAIQIGIRRGMINLGQICVANVEERLRDLIVTSVISMHRDIPTSYEIVWAMARTVPRRAYLELLAHPAVKVAYTLSLEIAENNGAENWELRTKYGLGVRLPRLRARNRAKAGAI